MLQIVLSQILKSCKQKTVDKEFAEQLNFKAVICPVHKKDYRKTE